MGRHRREEPVEDLPAQGPSPQESLQEWRLRILNWVLYGLAVFGVFVLIGVAGIRLGEGRVTGVAFPFLIFATLLLAAFVRRLPFVARALMLLGVLYACGMVGFLLNGIRSNAPTFFFATVAMSTILFEVRWGVVTLLLCAATIGGMGAAFTLGWLEVSPIASEFRAIPWFSRFVIFLGLGTVTLISTTFLIRRLERSVETELLQEPRLVVRVDLELRLRRLRQASIARLVGQPAKFVDGPAARR